MARPHHPILHLEVLPDGEPKIRDRVFCDLLERSVSVDTCAACSRCEVIDAGPPPIIKCSWSREGSSSPDPHGERTKVGTVLRDGALALREAVISKEAFEILHAHDRRSLPVVDESGVLVGLVHESSFARQPLSLPVTSLMRPPTVVPEAMPVRTALLVLASTHQREVTVVTEDGRPLGIFRDIDGLRWLTRQRDGARLRG